MADTITDTTWDRIIGAATRAAACAEIARHRVMEGAAAGEVITALVASERAAADAAAAARTALVDWEINGAARAAATWAAIARRKTAKGIDVAEIIVDARHAEREAAAAARTAAERAATWAAAD